MYAVEFPDVSVVVGDHEVGRLYRCDSLGAVGSSVCVVENSSVVGWCSVAVAGCSMGNLMVGMKKGAGFGMVGVDNIEAESWGWCSG